MSEVGHVSSYFCCIPQTPDDNDILQTNLKKKKLEMQSLKTLKKTAILYS
jgi:hypothetical protein